MAASVVMSEGLVPDSLDVPLRFQDLLDDLEPPAYSSAAISSIPSTAEDAEYKLSPHVLQTRVSSEQVPLSRCDVVAAENVNDSHAYHVAGPEVPTQNCLILGRKDNPQQDHKPSSAAHRGDVSATNVRNDCDYSCNDFVQSESAVEEEEQDVMAMLLQDIHGPDVTASHMTAGLMNHELGSWLESRCPPRNIESKGKYGDPCEGRGDVMAAGNAAAASAPGASTANGACDVALPASGCTALAATAPPESSSTHALVDGPAVTVDRSETAATVGDAGRVRSSSESFTPRDSNTAAAALDERSLPQMPPPPVMPALQPRMQKLRVTGGLDEDSFWASEQRKKTPPAGLSLSAGRGPGRLQRLFGTGRTKSQHVSNGAAAEVHDAQYTLAEQGAMGGEEKQRDFSARKNQISISGAQGKLEADAHKGNHKHNSSGSSGVNSGGSSSSSGGSRIHHGMDGTSSSSARSSSSSDHPVGGFEVSSRHQASAAPARAPAASVTPFDTITYAGTGNRINTNISTPPYAAAPAGACPLAATTGAPSDLNPSPPLPYGGTNRDSSLSSTPGCASDKHADGVHSATSHTLLPHIPPSSHSLNQHQAAPTPASLQSGSLSARLAELVGGLGLKGRKTGSFGAHVRSGIQPATGTRTMEEGTQNAFKDGTWKRNGRRVLARDDGDGGGGDGGRTLGEREQGAGSAMRRRADVQGVVATTQRQQQQQTKYLPGLDRAAEEQKESTRAPRLDLQSSVVDSVVEGAAEHRQGVLSILPLFARLLRGGNGSSSAINSSSSSPWGNSSWGVPFVPSASAPDVFQSARSLPVSVAMLRSLPPARKNLGMEEVRALVVALGEAIAVRDMVSDRQMVKHK